MKIKIKDRAEKTFNKKDGSGQITIVTLLTEDGQKMKAWKGQFVDTLIKGFEGEVETKIQKDRDGFDETWIVAPRGAFGGKGFTPRNMWPEAYQMALKWMEATGAELTHENLDTQAAYFKEKFWTMNAPSTAVSNSTPKLPDAQNHPEEKTIDVKDIPF